MPVKNRMSELNFTKRRKYHLKKLYGISYNQYLEIYDNQNGKCAICGREETVSMKGRPPTLSVDHNEFTGKVRGLLCKACNVKLSPIEDDQWYRRAREYLERHEPGQW